MDFGLVLQNDPPAKALVDRMVRAEHLGFTHGWTFDSAVLWQEPFVIYSRILEHTEQLVVGPMVTNPGTLGLLAEAMRVIKDLAEGREAGYAHALDQGRWFGGMVGNHVADLVARYGESSGMVPEELTSYIEAREGYDYSHHGRADNPDTAFVPDETVERFCLIGPTETHVARLEQLKSLGVDQFAVYAMHDAIDEVLKDYASDVIPAIG